MEKYIEMSSFWGTARSKYITAGHDRLAVILPGQGYTNMAPLLYYPLSIALESGYDALAVEYGFQRGSGKFVPEKDSFDNLVSEVKGAINKCLEEKLYNEILFIGKSLGTFIQTRMINEFPEHMQRHILLTPLPECISVIKQTVCMVAVGTNDRVFKSEHLAEIYCLKNVTLMTVEGADHSMEKGGYKEDLKILTEVCGNIYSYINT